MTNDTDKLDGPQWIEQRLPEKPVGTVETVTVKFVDLPHGLADSLIMMAKQLGVDPNSIKVRP